MKHKQDKRFVQKLSVGILMFAIVGCQTTDPYTREEKISNAASQAAGNAFACAAMGVFSAALERRQGASDDILKNAAVCGAIGFINGVELDSYERKLLEEFEAAGVKIAVRGKNNVLEITQPITFNEGSSKLTDNQRKKAVAIGKIFAKYNKRPVDIFGHTSANEIASLGLSRAKTVRTTITSLAKGLRVNMINKKNSLPIGNEATEAGSARNRRVSIFIQLTKKKAPTS